MKLTHIEHIGIAVKNLEESVRFYENVFGLKCYAVEEVKDQMVRTAFFQLGQTKIELLESTDPEGPIASFVEKHGGGIHHIAYAVDDVAQSLEELKDKKVKLIDRKPRLGAENLHIAFLNPKSTGGVLTEICQHNKSNE